MTEHSSPFRHDNDAEPAVVIINNHADVDVDVQVKHEHGHDVVIVDIADIEACGRANTPPPTAHRYKVKIDHDYYIFDHRFTTGAELLEKAGKVPIDKFELEKRLHGGHYVAIEADQKVDLGECGIEVFESFPLDETEGC